MFFRSDAAAVRGRKSIGEEFDPFGTTSSARMNSERVPALMCKVWFFIFPIALH
jgi:hypothetical protein